MRASIFVSWVLACAIVPVTFVSAQGAAPKADPVLLASGANLELLPIGRFGGFRVWAECSLGASGGTCLVDTAATASIVNEDALTLRYPSHGSTGLRGIGGIEFNCPVIKPTDFRMAGLAPGEMQFLRCPNIPDYMNPLIGLAFFDGRRFTFDFPASRLEWSDTLGKPLGSFKRGNVGIAVEGKIGQIEASMGFDTGAPVTLVDRSFVLAHPELFRPSRVPLPPELVQVGLTAYELTAPFEVGGVELDAPFVHAGDLSGFQSREVRYDFLLGANHLVQAKWFFDLASNRWSIAR